MKRGPSLIMGALCLLGHGSDGRAQPPGFLPVARGAETADALMLVEVVINDVAQPGLFLIARRDDGFWARPDDLDSWRIVRPAAEAIQLDGETMLPLSAIKGLVATFDDARQRLLLSVADDSLIRQRIAVASGRIRPTPGAFAAFLNYDLSLEYDDRVTGGAFLEAGVSDDWGLVAGTTTVGNASGADGVTRLDSYYLRDFPERLTRLVVGDTVTDAREWTRQIRFGGIRYGTEFGVQPGLVTFPVPEFADRAAVPSNVELLVNDALRYQTRVGQGPFTIDQAPIVTGAGEVTLVLRDALGVERRVQSSYYVSSRLLRRGLSAWSLEAGAERRGYGFRSFDYGAAFAAGSYRRGITDWLTLEGRAEVSEAVQMAGAGANIVWPAIGEFGVAGAVSRGEEGKGALYRVYYSRISPGWNLAVSYQRATRDFDQLGIDFDRDRITKQFQATAGVSLGRFGNAALSWTDLEYADGNRTRVLSGNYSVSLGNLAYLNLFAFRTRAENARWETTAGIGVTVPFGPRRSAYVQADSRNVLAELRQTAPTEGGWGYRLATSTGETDRQQAELNWRGDVGEVSLEAARFDGDLGIRALASGGLLIAGERAYATRRVEDGLAVVEVPGQSGVRIYQENRLVTRTDDHGRAILPDLRPYEENRISLAPSDLPLDARMPDDNILVVPRFRGAARARFGVKRDRPATIVVAMPADGPVEVGATILTSLGESAFVGYGGEIFVRETRQDMTLDIDTAEGTCRVTISAKLPEEVLPRIGPLPCQARAGQ
ncbi:fimbria/pilus outer membrane usher protein [Sphingopyxis sp. PAMC25046]|uniref:fimbria/pilus outer membrane usher protein n=1 Tax=Sphingopyxis sp. PAMC25046 TaxID=2565556 RepID=UPI001FFAD5F9|nr:fimbria/pilus outer membrane usher protein [Sphingopyxis sp. PAMC25046]